MRWSPARFTGYPLVPTSDPPRVRGSSSACNMVGAHVLPIPALKGHRFDPCRLRRAARRGAGPFGGLAEKGRRRDGLQLHLQWVETPMRYGASPRDHLWTRTPVRFGGCSRRVREPCPVSASSPRSGSDRGTRSSCRRTSDSTMGRSATISGSSRRTVSSKPVDRPTGASTRSLRTWTIIGK